MSRACPRAQTSATIDPPTTGVFTGLCGSLCRGKPATRRACPPSSPAPNVAVQVQGMSAFCPFYRPKGWRREVKQTEGPLSGGGGKVGNQASGERLRKGDTGSGRVGRKLLDPGTLKVTSTPFPRR